MQRQIFELTGNARPISVPAKRKYLAKDIGYWCQGERTQIYTKYLSGILE
jgi:hypothetical protein